MTRLNDKIKINISKIKENESITDSLNTKSDRDKLIRKYAYLVNWIVNRLPVASLKGYEKEDLIGYGTIGLIESVDRFDPSRNINFESFATARIRGAIYDELRASDFLSRGARKKVKTLSKAVADLEATLGRSPSNKEIAENLSIPLDELRQIQQEAQIGIYSLDETREGEDESCAVIDTISSDETPALEQLQDEELKKELAKAIESLPEREQTVIGLYHYKKLTFREIAHILDVSESRASQLHARAIILLKSKLVN